MLGPLLLTAVAGTSQAADTSWALLYANGSSAAGGARHQQCLDAVGGGAVIDTFSCVDPHASNAANELFNLTASGQLLVQAGAAGACVVAAQCAGHSSGLCQAACDSSASRWLQRGAGNGAVALSPASASGLCLTFDAGLASKLSLKACAAGSVAQMFTWGVALPPPPPPPPAQLPLQLRAFDPLLPFEGIGALSAGADAALLFDYEPAVRDRILDLLFLPHFPGGASLQILKVEIPGDVQSTCGSESSHEHFDGDLSFKRGYEFKLMHEARKRNPAIRIYALEWSVPGWIGGANSSIHDPAADYSEANRKYTLDWLRGARDVWNISSVDFLGFWNEPGALAPVEYVLAMRSELDAAGFGETKLVAIDSGMGGAGMYVKTMASSPALQRAVHAFGFHGGASISAGASWLPAYRLLDPATRPQLWASEDGNLPCSMSGAQQWGQTHLSNWLTLNFTATVRWSLIWSAYPGTICNGAGLLRADQPWANRFQQRAPNLAATAHITWFTQPGWFQLPAGRGSAVLNTETSAVTWVNEPSGDFTTVVQSLEGKSVQVVRLMPQQVKVGRFPRLRLYASHLDPRVLAKAGGDCEDCKRGPLMTRQADLVATADGSFTLQVRPGFMYTVTSLPAPAAAPEPPALPAARSPAFPLPLTTDFAHDAVDSMPRYFNNYEGSFSIAESNGTRALKQWVFSPPFVWHFTDDEPLAIVGPGYQNYELSSAVRVDPTNASDPHAAYVSICGRMTKLYGGFGPKPTGYCLELRASVPPPPPPAFPDRVRLAKCMGSAGQQWTIGSDRSIKHSSSGGCLTLPAASVEPVKCGRSPLPPCVQIPNGSPLIITACGQPLLATQKWTTALAEQATESGGGGGGKWVQFDGGNTDSSPCIEVNMASVHAGDKKPQVDTWTCVTNGLDNLVWSLNGSQLMSQTVGLSGMCLEAPATVSPPPPPPPSPDSARPMWRLVAHASYRFTGNGSADRSGPVVLRSGVFDDSFDLSAWHSVKLSMRGANISAAIDGHTVAQLIDSPLSFDHGLAGLGSGWNVAWYQNVSIVPLAPAPPAGAVFTLVDTNTGIETLTGTEPQWLGMKLRLAAPAVLVSMARFRAASSQGVHNLSLFAVDSQAQTSRLAASTIVHVGDDSKLDLGGFVWSPPLPSPVSLQPGEYVLASQEQPGLRGDPVYVQGANGPCAGNSDGHDGSSPWLLPLLGNATVSLLGAARSVGKARQWDGAGTSLGLQWDVSEVSDQSQHGYGPLNLEIY